FVIRPGFQGKVDEFGMLIPFPSPPSLRKVPDHVFPHVAAAIDPPEVIADLQVYPESKSRSFRRKPSNQGLQFAQADKKKADVVRVIKKEAVGMYEVVVLEAGSAAALKKWMDEHKFKYPDGMDKVCNEYIDESWCFVAIKTKVGQKDGAEPRPGRRTTNTKLPSGSNFDGHVQAMGFRFQTDELVVPMRLSAFNDGELRNIVYLVTDGPRKIRSIPEEYVVRQISGKQLFKNVTQPLPLRILGGTEKDLRQRVKDGHYFHIRSPQPNVAAQAMVGRGRFGRGFVAPRGNTPAERLKQARDPAPHNGAAKELFASDLLAIRSGELSLPHEEQEKELLRVGERFGLRGKHIDQLNAESLKDLSAQTVKAALKDVEQITLTVVDGDFPREVLSSRNLLFAEYKMPNRRNKPEVYDATLKGPAGKKQGVLQLGFLDLTPTPAENASSNLLGDAFSSGKTSWAALLLLGFGIFVALRRSRITTR
ncbi:MAG: DUF2330 domain-containing protein, partial [Planctomycetales bacterium]